MHDAQQASSVFMRSDSVQSVQSVESNCSSLVCEHCRCDDCILGITDHHVAIADLAADLEGKMQLQSQFLSSVAEAAPAAEGDGLGAGGGDVRQLRGLTGDNGNFKRKVRGRRAKGQNGVKRQVWLDCDIISLWVAFPFPYLVPIGVRRRPYETEVKARASRNLLRPPQIFNLPCRPGGAVGHEFFLYLSRWSSSTHVDLL